MHEHGQGGASPNAWNAAHSTAMLNAHHSDRAEQRRVARAQVAHRVAHAG